jgi:hypothetical protein
VPSCALYRGQESAFSSHQEDQPKAPKRIRAMSVPERAENCGNQRSLTDTRTASDLGTYRLTRCVKHTFMQRVAGSNPAERATAREGAARVTSPDRRP